MIYLDNNATTAVDPQAIQAMCDQWQQGPANASSQHAAGRRARQSLDVASDSILACLNVPNHQLFFTSGGTEANNWAIALLARASSNQAGQLIISTVEHPSVLLAADRCAAAGETVRRLPVDRLGCVDPAMLDQWLTDAEASSSVVRLVSVMAANNETGTMQPIGELADVCRRHRVPLHTDASQVVGKMPLDMAALGVSALTLAAHKFHGPTGIGALIVDPHLHIEPMFTGGAQQLGHRAGTEAIALAVGMSVALQNAVTDLPEKISAMHQRQQRLESGLRQRIADLVVHGEHAPRLPQTSCLSIAGIDRQALLMRLDLDGIACSSGSACASGSSQPSHVLTAMGVEGDLIDAAIRLSASVFNTDQEIDEVIERISLASNRLRDCCLVEKNLD